MMNIDKDAKRVIIREIVRDIGDLERRLDGARAKVVSERAAETAVRVDAALRRLRRALVGGVRGSAVPYGFRLENDRLLDDRREMPGLREILGLRMRGWSYGRIAARLDAKGRPTRRGGKWTKQVVKDICARAGVK